ncbi:MAG: hypothetical protein JJU06_06010 [Ectothiorhodospiraceae bacterium]|nr:hypothetical protein [Ectothiorhodospiraceae bacterium]
MASPLHTIIQLAARQAVRLHLAQQAQQRRDDQAGRQQRVLPKRAVNE